MRVLLPTPQARISRALPILITSLWLSLASAPSADLYLSPNGSDANPGTAQRPFATLHRARDAVRQLRLAQPDLAGPINVIFLEGTYLLAEPVEFSPLDSGTPASPVVYSAAPGKRVVLSGGRRIQGWQQVRPNLWRAPVPETRTGNWRFNQLFVNGTLRTRARIPNEGFLRVAGCPEGTPRTVNYHTDCQSFQFSLGDIRADWSNLQNVEVIVYHFWTDSHLPILSVDATNHIVTFAHKAGKVFTDDFSEEGARYIVENVFEGLDAPGEWYLDASKGEVYYLPLAGENLARAEVMAPHLPAFIHIKGEPTRGRFVEHLWFRNLHFEYSHFRLPPGNSNDRQGSASVPAAVTIQGARFCRFEQCAFRNLGTWALEAGNGCSDLEFAHNELSYLAAGGIRITGGTERNHPLERTARNRIVDNHLHHYGEVYPSAVGVLLMNTEENLVAHNHIHHGFYTGISIGWVWGYGRSISQGNRIEYNHVHDIGQGLLSDMGAIYTLGVSPGTILRNNLIHDVDANRYGGWGIYHDEGSTHLLVESNVVYRTKFAPFNVHYAKEVTVRNNIFALGRLEQLSRTRSEPHRTVFLERNIIYWSTGELFSKNWKDFSYPFHVNPNRPPSTENTTFDSDWNLFWNPELKLEQVKFAGGTWAQWQARGKDRHSIYADPRFVNPAGGDFTLRPDSPAFSLGFQPIDLRSVGPRPRATPH